MKPRLSLRHGIWRCNRPGERNPAGFGYTAKDAFDEWLTECWRRPVTANEDRFLRDAVYRSSVVVAQGKLVTYGLDR